MSVKVNSNEMLDANAYSKMIIRGVKGNYFIRVSGDIGDDQLVSISYRLTDDLKKMNDIEKIVSVVDSFLESTEMNCIELSALCVGCKGEFIKISGTRDLYLQTDDMQLVYNIIKMIKKKYDRDRYRYCENVDIKDSYNIVLDQKKSAYSREFVSCNKCNYHTDDENSHDVCSKYIQFRLMYSNGKITAFDRRFIERFIYDKLWEVGLSASVTEMVHDIRVLGGEKDGAVVDGYCITCGNLKIKFNCSTFSREYVFNLCNSIVNRYNSELNERDNSVKKRQLKMEGF